MIPDDLARNLDDWLDARDARQKLAQATRAARQRLWLQAVGVVIAVACAAVLFFRQANEIADLKAGAEARDASLAKLRDDSGNAKSEANALREQLTLARKQAAMDNDAFSRSLADLRNDFKAQQDAKLLQAALERERANDTKPFVQKSIFCHGPYAAWFLNEGATHLAFCTDARHLVAARGEEVQVWDVVKREVVQRWKAPGTIRCLDVRPHSKVVAVGCGNKVIFWDFADQKEVRSFTVPDGDVAQISFSAYGPGLVVVSRSVQVWSGEEKADKPLNTLKAKNGEPGLVAVLTSGVLVQHGPSGRPCMWDVGKDQHADLDEVPDGNYGPAVSSDNNLWRLGPTTYYWKGNRVQATLLGNDFHRSRQTASGYTFSPNGHYLAAVGNAPAGSGALFVWEVFAADDKVVLKDRVAILELPGNLNAAPRAVVFSPDGTWLAVATSTAIALWDARALLTTTDPGRAVQELQEEVRLLRERVRTLEAGK